MLVVLMDKNVFEVVIEKDEDGIYVASVPVLPGCHTQADSIEELRENIKEAIEAYLEATNEEIPKIEFVGTEKIKVATNV